MLRKKKLIKLINYHLDILKNDFNNIDSYHALTSLYLSNKDYQKAYNNLEELEKNHPSQCDAIFYQERSLCLMNFGRLEEAINDLTSSIRLNPNLSETYNNRGNLYKDLAKYEDALSDFNKAISINTKFSDAFNNRANLYKSLKMPEEALNDFNQAIYLNPMNHHFLANRALLNYEIKNLDNALNDIEIAIKLNKNASSYKIRSDIHLLKGDYNDAIEDLNSAINLDPNNEELINSRGLLYQYVGRYKDAEIDFESIKKANGELSSTQKFNLSICYLFQHKFDIAWKYYSNRKNVFPYSNNNLRTSKPYWDPGKKNGLVYISNEQGIGDQILYSSLLPDLLKVNNNIILSVDEKLENLFRRSFKDLNIFPVQLKDQGNIDFLNDSNYDYHLALADLPGIFRNSLESFSNQQSNFLIPNISESNDLRKNIESKSSKIICGISWKSNSFLSDFKSLKLIDFLTLLKNKSLSFVNLQYGDVDSEISDLKKNYNLDILNIDSINIYNDIDSLASLINACDLIITSSNVTAHISGALGKTTYLLSPYGKGKIWYWEPYAGKNLWYPSIIAVEQENPKTWDPAMKKIIDLIGG